MVFYGTSMGIYGTLHHFGHSAHNQGFFQKTPINVNSKPVNVYFSKTPINVNSKPVNVYFPGPTAKPAIVKWIGQTLFDLTGEKTLPLLWKFQMGIPVEVA